ncbi:hypothetical protein CEXT_498361 [Caerostris extrusa]|uniref:Uncharacterized protein n=1 Tax=Caerostris extrusa TaxID=172846 RepID=A0AAV4M4V9_CAEEX|nr:hypothetical protein CEXT_498361 [Caerostris extrusa]
MPGNSHLMTYNMHELERDDTPHPRKEVQKKTDFQNAPDRDVRNDAKKKILAPRQRDENALKGEKRDEEKILQKFPSHVGKRIQGIRKRVSEMSVPKNFEEHKSHQEIGVHLSKMDMKKRRGRATGLTALGGVSVFSCTLTEQRRATTNGRVRLCTTGSLVQKPFYRWGRQNEVIRKMLVFSFLGPMLGLVFYLLLLTTGMALSMNSVDSLFEFGSIGQPSLLKVCKIEGHQSELKDPLCLLR